MSLADSLVAAEPMFVLGLLEQPTSAAVTRAAVNKYFFIVYSSQFPGSPPACLLAVRAKLAELFQTSKPLVIPNMRSAPD